MIFEGQISIFLGFFSQIFEKLGFPYSKGWGNSPVGGGAEPSCKGEWGGPNLVSGGGGWGEEARRGAASNWGGQKGLNAVARRGEPSRGRVWAKPSHRGGQTQSQVEGGPERAQPS